MDTRCYYCFTPLGFNDTRVRLSDGKLFCNAKCKQSYHGASGDYTPSSSEEIQSETENDGKLPMKAVFYALIEEAFISSTQLQDPALIHMVFRS
jgi:hypothetical protein